MKFAISILALGVGLSLSAIAGISEPAEVESIFATIENNYGPLQYKESRVGLDWQAHKDEYREKLLNAESTDEFYMLIARFFGQLRDAHVSVRFPSSYGRMLPLQMSYVEGKIIVNWKDVRGLLHCPVAIGDEVKSIGGKNPNTLLREILAHQGVGNRRADLALATMQLTQENQMLGHQLSSVEASTKIKFIGAKGEISCEIPWLEGGLPYLSRSIKKDKSEEKLSMLPMNDFSQRMKGLVETHNKIINLTAPIAPISYASTLSGGLGIMRTLGHKKPFFPLPKDFKPIKDINYQELIDATGFYAGTFKRNGKTVGLLRIPSYGVADVELAVYGIRLLIQKLERKTDYLIIDQTNNPGGYALISDLVVRSFVGELDGEKHMKFAMKPSASYLRQIGEFYMGIKAEAQMAALYGTDEDEVMTRHLPQLAEDFAKLNYAWENELELSAPISMATISEIMITLFERNAAHRVATMGKPLLKVFSKFDFKKDYQYTKPVYMLVNELDFSGGDATPANLQDYGRATIVGVNTGGAGGAVIPFENTIRNRFSYSLTNSLMVRPGYVMVENNGVKPDVAFDVTVQDVRNNYANYFERLLQVIEKKTAK